MVADADIAFVNGGGIRAPLKKGPITYGDPIKIHPYGNTLTMVKATGAQILDALELASRSTQKQANDGKNAVGEWGGFLQVSGLKYTIDTSIPTSVELDDKNMFVAVTGDRRVKDVGDGFTMFQNDELLINEGMLDNQVLMTYVIEKLGNEVTAEYAEPKGRITILWEPGRCT